MVDKKPRGKQMTKDGLKDAWIPAPKSEQAGATAVITRDDTANEPVTQAVPIEDVPVGDNETIAARPQGPAAYFPTDAVTPDEVRVGDEVVYNGWPYTVESSLDFPGMTVFNVRNEGYQKSTLVFASDETVEVLPKAPF